MTNKALNRAYEILEGVTSDKAARGFQFFIVTLISANVLMVIVETEEAFLSHL